MQRAFSMSEKHLLRNVMGFYCLFCNSKRTPYAQTPTKSLERKLSKLLFVILNAQFSLLKVHLLWQTCVYFVNSPFFYEPTEKPASFPEFRIFVWLWTPSSPAGYTFPQSMEREENRIEGRPDIRSHGKAHWNKYARYAVWGQKSSGATARRRSLPVHGGHNIQIRRPVSQMRFFHWWFRSQFRRYCLWCAWHNSLSTISSAWHLLLSP